MTNSWPLIKSHIRTAMDVFIGFCTILCGQAFEIEVPGPHRTKGESELYSHAVFCKVTFM